MESLIFVQNTENNLAFYEMSCMQHTLLRTKIIFLVSEMGCWSTKCNSFYENCLKHVYQQLGKTSVKKNSNKSDIVTIRSGTYLPYLNSDIKISDICSKTLYLPTLRK